MNPGHNQGATAVCTIVSKNYLAYARTLMHSVAEFHPEWKRYVLLVDEVNGYFDPGSESFELLCVADLPLPEASKFLFRYDMLELNTAVKPWLLQRLFEQASVERVVYLDPDIRLYSPMKEMEQLLHDGALMTLTPHLLAELDDDRHPSDRDILRAGCYNLGFVALSRHPELPRFLSWWQSKLTYDCRVDLEEGLFVDQRWMDLVPGLFSDVAILRHAGYNVAYWNLNHRSVRLESDGPKVGNVPLVFFHFSGLDPQSPAALSKHQDRFRLKDLRDCETLVKAYCQEVIHHGWETCKSWPYAFGALTDGTPITTSMRRYYRSHPGVTRCVGSNPFSHRHDYLNQSIDDGQQPLITRWMRFMWERRHDLRDAFPDIRFTGRKEFVQYFVEFGSQQEGIPEAFVAPVRESLNAWNTSEKSLAASNANSQILSARFQDDVDHPIGWLIWTTAKVVLTVAPVTRSPERIRQYYRWLRPLKHLLPLDIRRQLKHNLLRWMHRSESARPAFGIVELIRSLARWFRRRLPLRGDATPATPAEPTALAFGYANQHATIPPRAQPQAKSERVVSGDGFNVVGYFQARSGVGESARLCLQSATAVGLPITKHDINSDTASRFPDPAGTSLRAVPRHAVNLLHVNADEMSNVRDLLGDAFFSNRYNVGIWHWELPIFPDRWLGAFDLVDEIWAPSRFIQDSLSARSPRPVVKIPHAIRFQANAQATRADFGLPNDKILFLMMYDVQSYPQRKNPEGVIEAFRRAFGNAHDVTLVVKVNDSQRELDRDQRRNMLPQDAANIQVLDERMDRQRAYDLLELCDCVVSLHRSEGFGLVLAEAMYAGKPVIATGWSGNMEFMTPENSCPVDYQLVRLERSIGPYDRGQMWAEPNLDHAAELMNKIVSEARWARKIAVAGQATIRNEFSPERIGDLYRQRLKVIQSRQSAARRFVPAVA